VSDVPKYLEVYFGCFLETSTSTTTTPNPLPPWLTTRSTISFYPGLFDLDITPPPRRVPFTAPAETTTVSGSTEAATTKVIQTSTAEVATTVNQHIDEQMDGAVTEILEVTGNRSAIDRQPNGMSISHPLEKEMSTKSSSTEEDTKTQLPTSEDEKSPPVHDSDKLFYTSDRSSNDSVKIILSTLPPLHDKVRNNVSPSVSPHSGTVSPLSMCPPRNIRALSWSWTKPGREAILGCPQGTSGLARWSCVGGGHTARWATPSPDLSECQSVWMEKIIMELKKSELIINLANDLMQYVSVNALYGGDIKSAIDAMTIIAEKMQYQLKSIPTMEQREAMVMELVQSVTKTASSLLSDGNIPAWQDLPVSQQNRFLSNFIVALEKTGSLLPGAVALDQEVSMSSDNLLLTVRKISFRNIRGTFFPSLASLATPYWKDYSDKMEIPALVLMENMNSEGSQVVFLSLRNLEKLLIPGESNQTAWDLDTERGAKQVVNSQVIHLSFGEREERVRINEAVTMVFRHKNVGNVTNPRCVRWDRGSESWSDKFCQIVVTNSTHTRCECSRIGTFALLEEIEQTDGVARMTFLVMVIIAVAVSIIAFISMVLIFVYCHRIKVHDSFNKIKLSKADLSCFKNKKKCWSLNDTPTISEDLFPAGNGEAFDIVRNSDFMVLSRAALAAHDTNESQISQDFSRALDRIPGPQVHTRPRHLDVADCQKSGTMYTNVSCRMSSPMAQNYTNAQSHIYMEVDPLYSGFAHTQLLSSSDGQFLEGDTGLVSSNSSQTSSGYSTAPSEFNRISQHLYEVGVDGEYAENLHPHQFAGQMMASRCLPLYKGHTSQDYVTKDRVYSISQNCDGMHRHLDKREVL